MKVIFNESNLTSALNRVNKAVAINSAHRDIGGTIACYQKVVDLLRVLITNHVKEGSEPMQATLGDCPKGCRTEVVKTDELGRPQMFHDTYFDRMMILKNMYENHEGFRAGRIQCKAYQIRIQILALRKWRYLRRKTIWRLTDQISHCLVSRVIVINSSNIFRVLSTFDRQPSAPVTQTRYKNGLVWSPTCFGGDGHNASAGEI